MGNCRLRKCPAQGRGAGSGWNLTHTCPQRPARQACPRPGSPVERGRLAPGPGEGGVLHSDAARAPWKQRGQSGGAEPGRAPFPPLQVVGPQTLDASGPWLYLARPASLWGWPQGGGSTWRTGRWAILMPAGDPRGTPCWGPLPTVPGARAALSSSQGQRGSSPIPSITVAGTAPTGASSSSRWGPCPSFPAAPPSLHGLLGLQDTGHSQLRQAGAEGQQGWGQGPGRTKPTFCGSRGTSGSGLCGHLPFPGFVHASLPGNQTPHREPP